MPSQELAGLKIMIVEDNFFLAESISLLLVDHGAEVVGPAGRLKQALALAERRGLAGAFLDINLGSERCFPVAMLLQERSVPFLFLTGYDATRMIPPQLAAAPKLGKPYRDSDVIEAAVRFFARA